MAFGDFSPKMHGINNATWAVSVNLQVFTTSGNYYPTPGMSQVFITCIGGGGAGAGSNSANYSSGGGGGGGEYASGLFTAAQVGNSQIITIGTGGTGVSGATGNPGTTTSVGTLITAFGGTGGTTLTYGTGAVIQGSAGGTGGSGGTIRVPGQYGGTAWMNANAAVQQIVGAYGASSQYGAGGYGITANSNGKPGLGYGAGGGSSAGKSSTQTGGAGSAGIVICFELIA